jgi:ubiquinone/menaquinone biosynthesis C-methylase UbiE
MTNYQRLYDRMAPLYGAFWERVRPWRHYTEAVLSELREGDTILEIGAGPGVLHTQLAERYPLAVDCDLSTGMLKKTQQRLQKNGQPARLVQGYAEALPFAPNSFAVVTMTFVFSAIPDGPAAMRAFHRVLRPGGLLILVDACIPSNGNLPGRMTGRIWELFGDFMRNEAALMQQVGFEIVKRREFGAFSGIRLVVGRKKVLK